MTSFDGNGNIIAYHDTEGTRSAYYRYNSFGEIIEQSGAQANEFAYRFSTKRYNEETGLVAYERRFYSPAQGRFTSRDPIAEDGGLNLYGFVLNDAINAIDKYGLDIWLSKGGSNQTGSVENLHLNINVGNPYGNYDSYSFGATSRFAFLNPFADDGIVYKNYNRTDTPVWDKYLFTDENQDKTARKILEDWVGEEMGYQLIGGTCRSFCKDMFEFFEEDLGFGQDDSDEENKEKDDDC